MTKSETQEIVITNQLKTKASFGFIINKREQCYIPASIAHACNINLGETYKAEIEPNTHESAGKTPWFVTHIHNDEEDFSDVKDALRDMEFPVTAEEAGLSPARLERAWQKGEVIRIEARARPTHKPRVMWAYSWDVV